MTPVIRRVLLGNALSAIGNGLTIPLLIVYLGQVRGLGTAVAGFVVAYIAVVSLVLLPVSGMAVDRFGPRPVLLCGLLVEATGVALLTQVHSIRTAFAVATVVSLGGSFVWGPQSALLGRIAGPELRQRVFGIQFMLLNLGIGIGGIIAAVVVDVSQPQTFTWLYLGVAFTVNTATIVLLQLVSLRFMKNRSRSLLMATVAALWAVSWVLIGITGLLPVTGTVILICLSTLVFAVGETLWAPIAPSLVNDLAPDHLRGRYNSIQGLVFGISGALGPALAGILLGANLVALWVGIVVGGCALAGFLAIRLRGHLTPALDGRLPAEAASGTMPV